MRRQATLQIKTWGWGDSSVVKEHLVCWVKSPHPLKMDTDTAACSCNYQQQEPETMDLDSLVNQPNQPIWIKGKFQFSERPHLKALRQTAIEKGTQHPSLASAYVHTGMCTPPPTPPHKIGHEPKVKEQKTKFPRMYTLRRKKHDWNIYAETWTYIHIQEQKIKLAKIKLLQSQKTIEP